MTQKRNAEATRRRNAPKDVLRHRKWILMASTPIVMAAVFAACSHGEAKRIPAADSADMLKESRDFTLINDPEVEKLVRVYKGTANSKVARIGITSATNVICQEGSPLDGVAPSAQQPYMFDAKPDQDIFCYSVSGGPPAAPIRVEYFVPKATATYDDAHAPDYNDIQAKIANVSASNYDFETKGYLQGLNLSEKVDITAQPNPLSKVDASIRPGTLPQVATGDYLEITQVQGGIGPNKKQVETAPIQANGLIEKWVKDKKTGVLTQVKVEDKPIKTNPAMVFPDERPNRLICTIATDGAAPTIFYRGGDALTGWSDKEGKIDCTVNRKKKNPGKLVGGFTVTITKITKAPALERLNGMAKSREDLLAAYKQHLDDEALVGVRGDANDLFNTNVGIMKHYGLVTQRRAQEQADARAAWEKEMRDTEVYFPSNISISYRRGPHRFSIRPVKKTVESRRYGTVDNVNYDIVGGETLWFPQNKKDPKLLVQENIFAPISTIESKDKWGTSGVAGIDFTVCPKMMNEVNQTIVDLANRSNDPTKSNASRLEVWKKLKDSTERKNGDCEHWYDAILGTPDFRPIPFKRQGYFRFCYRKGKSANKDGRDTFDAVAYIPNRILASYVSPTNAGLWRELTEEDNKNRGKGNGHPFFDNIKITEADWSSEDKYANEICVPNPSSRSLFPETDTDGVVKGFGLTEK